MKELTTTDIVWYLKNKFGILAKTGREESELGDTGMDVIVYMKDMKIRLRSLTKAGENALMENFIEYTMES